MSTSSQFLPSANSLGDIKEFPESGSLLMRGAESWSRAGTIYPALSYPRVASSTALAAMVNGIASTIPATTSYSRGIATNGTGTWVRTISSSSTQLEASTDGGATFTAVTHNVGCKAVDVVWNASVSRFIAVGCTNNIVYLAYSTNGTSWTAGTSLTPGVTPTADTIRALCDGTTVVVAWIPSSGQYGIATTVNGTSYTQRTIAASGTAQNFYLAVLPSLGGTRWIISGVATNSDCYQSANADGSGTWSSVTMTGLSSIGNRNGFAGGNGIFIMTGVTAYATSTNGTAWTVRNYPSQKTVNRKDGFWSGGAGIGSYSLPNWLMFDGNRFVSGTANGADFSENAQGIFGYTIDGITWYLRQLTYTQDTGVTAGQLMVFSSGTHLLAAQAAVASSSTTVVQYSLNWATSCDYVGKARPVGPTQTNGDAAVTYYSRID